MIFDRHPEYRERYDRHFEARGYYCETVGNVNEETIKKYIDDQYKGSTGRRSREVIINKTGKRGIHLAQDIPCIR